MPVSDERPLVWIERLAARLPLPYPFVGIIIAAIVGIIFFFFSTVVAFFPWEYYHQINVLSIAGIIILQVTGIIFLLRKTDDIFRTFLPTIFSEDDSRQLYQRWIKRFHHSRWYTVLVILVLLPFVLSFRGFAYHTREPAIIWSGLLDIFMLVVSWFNIYLLAVILWIMLCFVLVLRDIEGLPFRDTIRVDIFSVDSVGGLKPLQDFTLQILILYFACCALAIASNVSPFELISYDSLCLICLLGFGVCVFVFMITRIRSLVRGRIGKEIDKIDHVYEEKQEKLIGMISADEPEIQKSTLDVIKTSLDALHTQRERMLVLYNNCTGYDLISVIKFSGGFTLSIIAYIQKILEFGSSLIGK